MLNLRKNVGTIAELNNALQAFDFSLAVQQSIEQTGKGIIERNQAQLQEGKDSTGQALQYPYAWQSYTDYKLRLNPRGVRDLKLTGAFYEGMITGVSQSTFIITSRDPKTSKIIQREGEDVFGLTTESAGSYAQTDVLPVLQSKIEKATGLKFE